MSERIKVGELEPGILMDRAVARAVGWGWHGNPSRDCATCSCIVASCYAVKRNGFGDRISMFPSRKVADAIAALEATGMEWDITKFADPGREIVYESIVNWPGESSEAGCGIRGNVPEAACVAILRWAVATKPEEFEA